MPHREQEMEENRMANVCADEYAKLVCREMGWATDGAGREQLRRAYLAGWEGRKAEATKRGWVR